MNVARPKLGMLKSYDRIDMSMRGQMTVHEQQTLLNALVRLTTKTELCANRASKAYI